VSYKRGAAQELPRRFQLLQGGWNQIDVRNPEKSGRRAI